MATTTKLPKNYENNPFFIATNGITLLFNLARGVAFFFVALTLITVFRPDTPGPDNLQSEQEVNNFVTMLSGWSTNEWVVAIGGTLIVLLAVMLISALIGGVSAYTSLRLSRGEKVGFGEAFREAFEHLWSFLWLQIIIFVKIILWTLLFIVPGIIMSVRYSLASVAFFDDKKNLRGNAAIKESLRLTKGAWLTTYAGNALLNFITFGVISWLVTAGANAVLYGQLDAAGDKKPQAHWLSWLALVLPFAILVTLILFVIVVSIMFGIKL